MSSDDEVYAAATIDRGIELRKEHRSWPGRDNVDSGPIPRQLFRVNSLLAISMNRAIRLTQCRDEADAIGERKRQAQGVKLRRNDRITVHGSDSPSSEVV